MKINKSLLFATLISISTLAQASLTTYNYTHEDSSVRVTSGVLKPCSSDANKFTPKINADGTPGISTANDTEVNLLCKTSQNYVCSADIYNTRNCNGEKVGYASLNLKTKTVTSVTSINSKYVFLTKNNGTLLEIRYAS